MTDTSTDLLTVPQVCARLPGKGSRRVYPSTVTRWILTGCPARTGGRVKLRALRVGSRWLVDPTDLTAFFGALAAPAPSSTAPLPVSVPDARERAARAAEALARRGA